MIRVHVWYEFSSSFGLLLRLWGASSTFPWLRRLRALPSGPTALTIGRRDRTGIFVFIWCEWGWSEEKDNKILYRAWKSTRFYSVGLQLRRHLFYCSTWISPCWLLHTYSTQIYIIPTSSTTTQESDTTLLLMWEWTTTWVGWNFCTYVTRGTYHR